MCIMALFLMLPALPLMYIRVDMIGVMRAVGSGSFLRASKRTGLRLYRLKDFMARFLSNLVPKTERCV